MKHLKNRICLFDLVVMLVAVLVVVFLWFLLHGDNDRPVRSSSAQWFLEDIYRNGARAKDAEKLLEIETYNIIYTLRFEGVSGEYLENYAGLHKESVIQESYSGAPIGTLDSIDLQENSDGTLDVCMKVRLYALFDKIKIRTPQGLMIKVGRQVAVRTEDGLYLGAGTVCWISH